jgi:hypothetical protein
MRSMLFAAWIVTLCGCAHVATNPAPAPSARQTQQHPLMGGWASTEGCQYLIVLSEDGEALLLEGEQMGNATYQLSEKPSAGGTYELSMAVTQVKGSPGCAHAIAAGDKITRYLKFTDPTMDYFQLCASAAGDQCTGKYGKVKSLEVHPL